MLSSIYCLVVQNRQKQLILTAKGFRIIIICYILNIFWFFKFQFFKCAKNNYAQVPVTCASDLLVQSLKQISRSTFNCLLLWAQPWVYLCLSFAIFINFVIYCQLMVHLIVPPPFYNSSPTCQLVPLSYHLVPSSSQVHLILPHLTPLSS